MESNLIDGTDVPVRELRPVAPTDLVWAEHRHLQYYYVMKPGQTLETLMVPDSWALTAKQLHRHDTVEVHPLDDSFVAVLMCTATGPEYAKMHLLYKVDLPTHELTTDDLPLGNSVFFLGSKRLWAAMRHDQIIKHSFTTKQDAINWIIESFRS